MATFVQQSPQESAARAFWNGKMQEHPNIAGALAIAQEVAGFFLNGHFVVFLARWIIRVSGYVADAALLLAVVWISITSVAPGLVELVVSAQTMQYLVSFALVALAVIPEVILPNAIISAVEHTRTACQQRTGVSVTWAILFVLPTLMFFALTAWTLFALVANGGTYVRADGFLIGCRCFAGWTYGLLGAVYAVVGRKTLNQAQLIVTPAQPVAAAAQIDYEEIARQLLPTLREELTGQIERLNEQVVNLQAVQSVRESETAIEPPDEPEQENIVNLQSYRQVHDDETNNEPETGPTPRITVKLNQGRSAAKREAKREPAKASGTAQEKAARILKKCPDITAGELAKRIDITPQYASRILKKQSVN